MVITFSVFVTSDLWSAARVTQTLDVQVTPGETELILRLHLATPPAPPQSPQLKRGAAGIDVSRWQGIIDWEKVAREGIVFAGIRATMGSTGKDDQFARNWVRAREAGILRMAYCYFTNNFVGVSQLDNFQESLGGDIGELRPVLDIEPRETSQNPPVLETIKSQQANTAEVFKWLELCEKSLGIRPAIYSNRTALLYCTTMPDAFGKYPFWIAAHNNAAEPMLYKPWHKYMCWQYSRRGRVDGIAKPDGTWIDVDMNKWGEL